ncbi:putative defense protein 2 [Littorina saxatilis]|uniref:Reelin domain-containing protein n=1 Tax=Littorina saxatilis TaxID=31220 RepID=A0AAN9AUE8_9CAEN
MPRATLLVLSATAAILALVTCYPDGAPAKDCWTERPLHGDHMPAHGDPPYEITVDKLGDSFDANTYTPGEYIQVTISSRDGTPFKGYLLKVYSSNGVSAGVWGAKKGEQHVLRKCGVTHNNNTATNTTTIMWKAPTSPIMDTIQFKAIIVKDYVTFYNNVLSRPLKPDYPKTFMEKLFERLRAYANVNFNVSVPSTELLPGPLLAVPTTTLGTTAPVQTASSAKAELPKVA